MIEMFYSSLTGFIQITILFNMQNKPMLTYANKSSLHFMA